MPLGLRNSAQTFQRAMNHLLRSPTYHSSDATRTTSWCCQRDTRSNARHLRELFTVLRDAKLHTSTGPKCQLWPGRSHLRGVPRAVSRLQPRAHGTAHRAAQRPSSRRKKSSPGRPEAEAAFERTKKAMTEAVQFNRSCRHHLATARSLHRRASDTAHRCRAETSSVSS
ncbi:unnamed protein product [Trichogramma brassicae]|uniref:Uncharacterized protein n=1 Tax=Trichogramma brassicae TaxID=86971 RepID=A0A6H5HUR8_9HYME|nr:unnamed protein product [Trichogramma brassicae]